MLVNPFRRPDYIAVTSATLRRREYDELVLKKDK